MTTTNTTRDFTEDFWNGAIAIGLGRWIAGWLVIDTEAVLCDDVLTVNGVPIPAAF